MSVTSTVRPALQQRKPSRVPGGFETDNEGDLDAGDDDDDDLPPIRSTAAYDMTESRHNDPSSSSLLPGEDDSSDLLPDAQKRGDTSATELGHDDTAHAGGATNNTVLEEQEMNRKLTDFESSFVPELSHLSIGQFTPQHQGQSDFDRRENGTQGMQDIDAGTARTPQIIVDGARAGSSGLNSNLEFSSPNTPPGMYRTPAPEQQELRLREQNVWEESTPDIPNTSNLEQMSFSLSAARTVSRVQSMATIGGYETADDRDFPESPTKRLPRTRGDPDTTPRKNNGSVNGDTSVGTAVRAPASSDGGSPNVSRRRPKYLNSRSAHARLSFDSMASSTTDASDATLSADFALQSGGAAPESRLQRKPRMTLSRSTSLGSIVSGVSNMSDDEGSQSRKNNAGTTELGTLPEESPARLSAHKLSPSASIITPKASTVNMAIPTDTVVANHVRDLEVPGSFARQYRQLNPVISPEKPMGMAAMTPSAKKGLTLKEHRSTVEKLGKENFDLKMKIHFLDQALQRRSDDGVKEMITENVQLKSDRMRLEKDNHSLRKQIRELQRKLESLNEDGSRDSPNADQGYGTDEDRSPTIEEEVIYLRERIETSETEIEKLRSENVAKETEKRRLAEMVRNLGDTRATISDVGSREERDMWKDMLESETIAREQSEEENKKLRDEIAKLRQDTFGNNSRLKRNRVGSSVASRSSSIDGSAILKSEQAETDRLRHEVSELQKMISAQASTLTSRNKEKERLYQEIEDLKLGKMSGVRSVAGDSIFDRSASRARSNSRASNGTRLTRLSEPEREQFESRIGELRDEVSQLRLDNQNLQNEFDEALVELDALDQQAQEDLNTFNEEMAELAQERDTLLREVQQHDIAFEQLKTEAQEEIDGLGDELDAKVDECTRLEQELKEQMDHVDALQNEVRSTSEGLARLEADSQQSLSSYQGVKSELDTSRRELERMEKALAEAEGKVQRLTVQQESSHNEIAFLREEQDGDKIKIGDMESLLKKTHFNLETEREKAKDLERRLNEERTQRESVSTKEKQEVQRMINDLNREATTAKDELRRIRKVLSSKELDVTAYKERLTELEDGLRQIFRDPNSSRGSLLAKIAKMQRDLETTTNELDITSKRLDDHQNLLNNRDALLESSGLECRKLADILERERQARRQDKHSFEQSLKSHQQATRALSTNNARIAELEQARAGHRKQLSQLEAQFKDQLSERNQVLLTIWKKLSVLCGSDWAHNHSLINGNLPSQEVIGNMLFWPGFSRNLLLAAKQVEGTLAILKDKIKRTERDLWKEYHSLEQQLDQRNKKLERIEESWEKVKLRQQEMEAGINLSRPGTSRDSQRLKNENQRLKAELQQYHQMTHANHARSHNRTASRASAFSALSNPHEVAMSMDGAVSAFGGGIPARHSSIGQNTARTNTNMARNEPSGGEAPPRSDSVMSATVYRNNPWSANSNSPEHSYPANHRHSLNIPAHGFGDPQPPEHGNFARPPVLSPIPQVSPHSANSRPPSSVANMSNAATAQLTSLPAKEAQWLHRMRELERRLKQEREQRLVDRTGMRKRLEEREAANEELRKELDRERVRRSWNGHVNPTAAQYAEVEGLSRPQSTRSNVERLTNDGYDHNDRYERDSSQEQEEYEDAVTAPASYRPSEEEQARVEGRRKFGMPSVNNRVVNVSGSAGSLNGGAGGASGSGNHSPVRSSNGSGSVRRR